MCGRGLKGGWDFPFQRQQAVKVVWLQSALHHTRRRVLIACPLPAAAVLALEVAALGVLVPALKI